MTESVFAAHAQKIWGHRYGVTVRVRNLTGGFPLNQDVIEGWLKSKITDNDTLVQAALVQSVAEAVETEQNRTMTDAVNLLASKKALKGFKRDDIGLYIEGRQVKAMIKEAISVAVQGGHITEKDWGKAQNKKWIKGFAAEHIFVPEERIYIYSGGELVREVNDKIGEVRFDFVHAAGNHGFKQSEVIYDAELNFTVESDYDFGKDAPKAKAPRRGRKGAEAEETAEEMMIPIEKMEDFWPTVFVTGERQGLGSDRSQGQGVFAVTGWEELGS